MLPGFLYFAFMFALGFLLGTLRVVAVEPALGVVPATLLELPLMLGASWLASGWIVRRWSVPPTLRARAVMGATALALLLAAETLLGLVGFGRTFSEQIAAFASLPGLLGLAAQLLAAAFPLLRLWR